MSTALRRMTLEEVLAWDVVLGQDRAIATVPYRRGPDWIGTPITDPAATLDMPDIGIALPLRELHEGLFDQ